MFNKIKETFIVFMKVLTPIDWKWFVKKVKEIWR